MKRLIYHCILLSLLLTVFSLTIFGQNTASSSTPTVDPLHPDIPSVSNGFAVGSPAGEVTVNGMGAAEYNLPIDCPNGGSLNPQLSLAYNSQSAGYGLAGYGFTVKGISVITRGKKTLFHNDEIGGITYEDSDNLFLDGKRLILLPEDKREDGAIYCLEGEPFTKIIVHRANDAVAPYMWFEVRTTDGKTYRYGQTISARITYEYKKDCYHVASWYVNRVEDVHGNYIEYNYDIHDLYAYPKTIKYGQNKNKDRGIMNKVVFEYKSLGSNYRIFHIENREGRFDRCISSITTSVNDSVYRRYLFTYDDTSDQSMCKYARLISIREQNGVGESLTPVQFNWNHLPSYNLSRHSIDVGTTIANDSIKEHEKMFFTMDLNGDGISDIGRVTFTTETNGNAYRSRSHLHISRSNVSATGEISYMPPLSYDIPTIIDYDDKLMDEFKNKLGGMSPMDFDGDGYNDLIIPFFSRLYDDIKRITFCLVWGSDVAAGTGATKYISVDLKSSYETPLFVTMDTDGDGLDEIICVEKSPKDGVYPAFILKHKGGTLLDKKEFTLAIEKDPQKMFCGDYNNDGLTDIIFLYEDGYQIFFNNGGKLSSQKFSDSNSKKGTGLKECWRIRQGDFDGDGLVDFVYYVSHEYILHIARNNGDGTFALSDIKGLDFRDQPAEEDNNTYSLQVWDIDYDGMSDVTVCKATYDYHSEGYKYEDTRIITFHSNGTTLIPIERITKKEENDAKESYIFTGDFDGDGYAELANYGCDLRNTSKSFTEDVINVYQSSTEMSQAGKIARVIDGMDNRTDIVYASGTSPKIYTKSNPSTDRYKYPLNTYTLPLSLVKSITSTNGIAACQTQEYTYKDLKVQMTGGGLVGFTESTVTNTTTGIVTNTRIVDRQYKREWLPRDIYVTKTVGDRSSWASTVYKVYDANNTYFMYDSNILDVDWDNNTTIIINQYDRDKGYLLEHTVESDFDDMEIYKKVTYSGYEKKSGMWLPSVVTKEQKHTDDPTPYSMETRYGFDEKGNVLSKIENYGTPLALETISTYDDYGNCLTSTSKGKGITGIREITEHTDYDPSGRFVVKSYQEPAAAVNTFTYDIWGHILTESDETEPSNILTTRHAYDKWGRLVSSLAPDGTKTETITGWGNSNDKKYYTLEKKSESPWVLTWYDNAGHEMLQQTFGPKNVLISQATEYNEKGQVKKVTNSNGKLCTSETFTYDNLGRIESHKYSSGKETRYTYSNRSVTTTTAGRTSIKTTDAWGNVVNSIDAAGNEVVYLYNSIGKPSSITTNGTTVTMEYDEAGNQKRLTDPDAGVTTYEYSADGILLKQTDAKGVETVNTYDALGRLSQMSIGGVAIKNTYKKSGYGKLLLSSKKMGAHIIQYTYDKFGRLTREHKNFRGTGVFDTRYEFDDRNRLAKITYPGDLEVNYQYDDYGHVMKMTADGKDVCQLASYDGLSTKTTFMTDISVTRTKDSNGYESEARITSYKLKFIKDPIIGPGPIEDPSIGIQSNSFSDHGRPVVGGDEREFFQEYQIGTLDRHDVSYDPLTDNLLARKRYGGSVESFGYDNLDRLTSVSTSTATTVTGTGTLTEVMGITYAPNGNILSKTGVGDYTYNSTAKPHAVMAVDNTDGLIPSNALSTSFNILGLVSNIEDEDSNRVMSFTYGPDLQRWSTTMSKNGQIERRTVYMGNYESITEGGVTREFYYLDGGVIIIKQNGEFKPYQAFTDNLGSILSVVDENGDKVFGASYDAWGCQTVTLNEIGLHRGYTGHEMLNEFGIINMNGRLYDPVLGRFFSPDNYVQMPDNSQNFNRYSYCLNNPLKYTDPSGELWWLAPIIGAYFGGSAANEEFNPLKWDFGNWRTYAGMAVGGLSAAAGAAIASSGTIMANTMSIAISSFIYSVGTNLYTGGESPVSINFGFCSYDVTNDNFGYLGKKENSVLSNVGYVFGAMANLSDFVALYGGGTNVDLIVQKKDAISHSALTNESENINISVGPYTELGEGINMEALKSINTTFKELSRTMKGKIWENHANDGIGWKLRINNVNKNILVRLSNKLQAKMDNKTLEWNLLGKSCVGYTSKALWSVGIPNLGGIHPYWLQLQMLTRQVGIYSSPYLYQIR